MVISSRDQYSEYLRRTQMNHLSNILLVTEPALLTNPIEANVCSWDLRLYPTAVYMFIEPRIVPIRAIPWIAFRHISPLSTFEVQHIADMWNYTSDIVRRAITPGLPDTETLTDSLK